MHFSLFIQRNTGTTPFPCSVYASTSNTGIIIVVIEGPQKVFRDPGFGLFEGPGFRILKEKGEEIRDCNYDRDTGFSDFNRRES